MPTYFLGKTTNGPNDHGQAAWQEGGGGDVNFIEGTRINIAPISGGAFFNTSVSNNNDLAARGFDAGQMSYIRPQAEPIRSDWVAGTDATIRITYSTGFTPGPGETLSIQVGYAFGVVGEALPDQIEMEDTFVVEGQAWRHFWTYEVVIPAANINPDADMIFLEVRRLVGPATDYPNRWFVHQVEVRYTALGLELP